MPRGISKDLENFKKTLEKGVLLVGGEAVDNNSIDVDDDTPVSVAIVVNVQGYGPHVGAIAAVQGHIDEALQSAHEILEEWEQEHNPNHFKELEDEYGERASEILTETFDGVMWELPVEEFVEAIKGTAAEKYIDVVEQEEEEEEHEDDGDFVVVSSEEADDYIESHGERGSELYSTESESDAVEWARAHADDYQYGVEIIDTVSWEMLEVN